MKEIFKEIGIMDEIEIEQIEQIEGKEDDKSASN
jgi:hypothetical protein